MLVTFPVMRRSLDWAEEQNVTIDTYDYSHFVLQSRGGKTDWYLVGYKYNRKYDRWDTTDFAIWYQHEAVKLYHVLKLRIKQVDVLHFRSESTAIIDFFSSYNTYVASLDSQVQLQEDVFLSRGSHLEQGSFFASQGGELVPSDVYVELVGDVTSRHRSKQSATRELNRSLEKESIRVVREVSEYTVSVTSKT